MLGDLDELVLLCRSPRARAHIGEAVRSYKAAAYRSAIIMTWIAVVHDIVDKLRELSLHGDAAATEAVESHDKFHRANDLAASLKFERNLLTVAKDKFELISESEFTDLERIQTDRHRCAHPSLSMEGEPFSPSAEAARAHIRAAIDHVLRQEPAQGRYALDMLMKQLNGDYFPPEREQAYAILSHGPLVRGREALVRSCMVVLLKALLRDGPDYIRRRSYGYCLQFIRDNRRDMWEQHTPQELGRLARTLDIAEKGPDLLSLAVRVRGLDELLPGDVLATLRNYVENMPLDAFRVLESLFEHNLFVEACEARVKKLTATEAHDAVWWDLPNAVWNRFIEGFCASDSFVEANTWAQEIRAHHGDSQESRITPDDADKICRAVIENRQVRDCNRRNSVLACVLESNYAGRLWDEMVARTDVNPDEVRALMS